LKQEHTVENLQFVVWYQSYRARFFDLTKQPKKCTATAFKFQAPDAARLDERVRESERAYDAVRQQSSQNDVRATGLPPVSPVTPVSPTSPTYADSSSTFPFNHASSLGQPPPSIQPLERDYLSNESLKKECSAVLQTFIKPGSPKELSLSDEMREMVSRDATWNTHPDVFLPVYEQIYDTLSTQSLPNFLKLSATNVNLPKALYWYAFGTAYMVFSLVIFIPLVLLGPGSVHERSWRCFSIPFSSLGLMQLYSGWKGLCTEVWSRGRAQLRPWDLQFLEEHETSTGPSEQSRSTAGPVDVEKGLKADVQVVGSSSSASTLSVSNNDAEKKPTTRTASGTSTTSSSEDRPALITPGTGTGTAQASPRRSEFPFETQREKAEVTAEPRMFGPERPLLDPRIRKVHALIVRDMLVVGVLWTAVWVAVVCAVPTRSV